MADSPSPRSAPGGPGAPSPHDDDASSSGANRDHRRPASRAEPHGSPEHAHDRAHGHARHHDHGHAHATHQHVPTHSGHARRLTQRVSHLLRPHSHDAADRVDSELEASTEGMRTLWISLVVLGLTALFQTVVVVASGSVALLGDTIHNVADALTAVPLAVAFLLGRRPATRRFTYGYGRAEDLAGVAVVLVIASSAGLAAYEAVNRLIHPRDVSHLPAVAIAGLVGFVGNEWVARYRIRTGRRIGSAALVADGLHARTDGFTSLAVLAGAGGVAAGWQIADPLIGLVITVAILAVLRDAIREIYQRLMDAVDPSLVDAAETALATTAGVQEVGAIRLRWIGHQLRAEADIVLPADLTIVQAHAIAVDAEHALIHAIPRLTAATVHTDHAPATSTTAHETLAHHLYRASPARF
ncbi:cation diffusion facilitator family transporter [Frankia sp. BMG5.11]|uniref:cation diffusion facilitator family transporter n=1 Tax=Parafrankia sp. BMG5.11 TaxID=222540 RepID=UPI001039B9CB|nr:cation diffusion facilitator family transporter [Parafrankia sp. BMG5.11]